MITIKTPAYRRIVFLALCVFAVIANIVILLELGFLFMAYKSLVWVAAAWMVFGLLGYALLLRLLPPTPILGRDSEPLERPEPEPVGRPFSVRDLPALLTATFGVSLAGPFWLLIVALGMKDSLRINKRWRQQFPNASKAEIREFLGVLLRSFDVPLPENYRLSPDDYLKHAYQRVYGPGATPDKTEVEKLAHQLVERYCVEVSDSLREDITVGELYTLIQKH